MAINLLKIATRKSPMALWQAKFIKTKLQTAYPHLEIQFVEIITQGDKDLETPLVNIGGKSLFVKELQQALLKGAADIAVHCIKDMSVIDCPGLTLTTIIERENPQDAFVSNHYNSLSELPINAVIGSSSPRRQSQLLSLRKDLCIKPLRGNVGTRLAKLDNGDYDAVVLAAAGLQRLGAENRIKMNFDTTQFIPGIGQGALGIECRENDDAIISMVAFLNHPPSQVCVHAERAVNRRLGGDCYTPIAAYANIIENRSSPMLHLIAMVGSLDGQTILRAQVTGNITQAEMLGTQCAEELLAQGAKRLID